MPWEVCRIKFDDWIELLDIGALAALRNGTQLLIRNVAISPNVVVETPYTVSSLSVLVLVLKRIARIMPSN